MLARPKRKKSAAKRCAPGKGRSKRARAKSCRPKAKPAAKTTPRASTPAKAAPRAPVTAPSAAAAAPARFSSSVPGLAAAPAAPAVSAPQPVPATPAADSAPTPAAESAPSPAPSSPVATHSGSFDARAAERLLWRAGCGPSPGQAEALAQLGLEGAVKALTRPSGPATLAGEAATVGGKPLEPGAQWGHDHLWLLDRMVRTDQPLMERMTLVWHDWFATSFLISTSKLMLKQNEMFRDRALGSFDDLLESVTSDGAMILWLNLHQNRKGSPNENYARELMELFTLGADRDAYTEEDVRELSRSLTGWWLDWDQSGGPRNFRVESKLQDTGSKTVFGKTGRWDWKDAVRLCLEHPLHASFFVSKLWSYFIPTAPSDGDLEKLAALYTSSGRQIRPVVEAILMHPDLYAGERMVKPPVVYASGMLRQQRARIDRMQWITLAEISGQRLFQPPGVQGWDDTRWLQTSSLRARWQLAATLLNGREIKDDGLKTYSPDETPEQAVDAALAFLGNPSISTATRQKLIGIAAKCIPSGLRQWQPAAYRGMRQNALRQLILTCPDLQTC